MTAAPGSPAYRNIARMLAEALERQDTRLSHSDEEAPQAKTRCARNYNLPDDALHICTGGKFCKGNCKPTRGTLAEYKSNASARRRSRKTSRVIYGNAEVQS